jgi:pimeloyl-ACP methyl ester carboxylesterase
LDCPFDRLLMLSSAVLAAARELTEPTSIELLQQIQFQAITGAQPLDTQPSEQIPTIQTSYVQRGSGGTPIVLLHGFDSSVLEFRRLLPLLTTEAWAIDLLGFGFTDRLPSLNFSPDSIRSHLYCFWQTAIRQPMILVGASMGGAAAIDFTLAYPEAVAKLVLIDSAGLAKAPPLGKLMFPPFDRLATNFLQSPRVRQRIAESAYYDPSWASRDALICAALHLQCPHWRQALVSFTKSGGYGDYGDRLAAIQQPTLILWGENDQIVGTKDAVRFHQKLQLSQLSWIAKCGHVPHLEKPQTTATRILNWI